MQRVPNCHAYSWALLGSSSSSITGGSDWAVASALIAAAVLRTLARSSSSRIRLADQISKLLKPQPKVMKTNPAKRSRLNGKFRLGRPESFIVNLLATSLFQSLASISSLGKEVNAVDRLLIWLLSDSVILILFLDIIFTWVWS
jgi:hypothetical protein